MNAKHFLFDWGDTLMADLAGQTGPMCRWPSVMAMPNAVEALERLSSLAHCHLATNARDSEPGQIRDALRRVGLDGFISRIFCFRSVGHAKPSPEFFAFISQELQCENEKIVMIGDDLEQDVNSVGLQRCVFVFDTGLTVETADVSARAIQSDHE